MTNAISPDLYAQLVARGVIKPSAGAVDPSALPPGVALPPPGLPQAPPASLAPGGFPGGAPAGPAPLPPAALPPTQPAPVSTPAAGIPFGIPDWMKRAGSAISNAGGAMAGGMAGATAPPPAAPPSTETAPAGDKTKDPGVSATPPGGGQGAGVNYGAPPSIIPAHEGRAVSPTTEAMMGQAQGERSVALEQGEKGELGANDVRAQETARQAAFGQATDIGINMQQRRRQAALDEQAGEYKRMQTEAATGKPDYDRWWKNQGTAEKIGWTLAQGLSSFGMGMKHQSGQSQVTAMINDAISRDIAQQRDALESKRADAKGAGDNLREMRERFGDEHLAELGERARQLEGVKLMGDARVAQAQSPILAAKWQDERGKLDAEQANLHNAFHPWQQSAVAGGGGGGQANYSDVKPEEVFTLSSGQHVTIPDTAAREKAVEFTNKLDQVKQAGQDVKRLLNMPFAQRAASPVQWQRQFKAAKEQMAMAELMGGGKGGVGATRLNIEALGDGNFMYHPGVDKAVNIVVANAQRAFDAHVAHSAGNTVQPIIHVNPKTGIQERKFQITGDYHPPAPAPTIRPVGQ